MQGLVLTVVCPLGCSVCLAAAGVRGLRQVWGFVVGLGVRGRSGALWQICCSAGDSLCRWQLAAGLETGQRTWLCEARSPQGTFQIKRSRFVVHIVSHVYFSPNILTFPFTKANKSGSWAECLCSLYVLEWEDGTDCFGLMHFYFAPCCSW